MRPVLALAVAALLVLGPEPAAGAPPRGGRADVARALGVLHAWDDRRALAWSTSDEVSLGSLYVDGSSAARSDVALLRSYTARGLVVRHLQTQVFGVRVLRAHPGRITMNVLDRVAGGEVADQRRTTRLPSTRPTVHRIELVRVGGTWLVESVSDWGRGPRAGRLRRPGR